MAITDYYSRWTLKSMGGGNWMHTFFEYIPIFKIEHDSALENGGRQSNTSGLPLFNKTYDPPSMVQKRNTQTNFFLTPSLKKPNLH